MGSKSNLVLDHKLALSIAAVVVLMALRSGVFSLVIGATIPGILWLLVASGILFLFIEGRSVRWLVGRPISTAGAGLVLLILVLIGIDEVINLLTASPESSLRFLVDAGGGVGYLVLAALAIVRIAKLIGGRTAGIAGSHRKEP